MRYAWSQTYRWPITHAYAGVLVFQGVVVLTHPVSESPLLAPALGVMAITAGILILTGLQWWRDKILALGLEAVGHTLGALVWATEIWLVWNIAGGPQWDNVTSLVFFAASVIKAIRLRRVASREKRLVKTQLIIAEGKAS